MTTRDSLLFAALSGTEDCPAARLAQREHSLRAHGRIPQADAVAATAQTYARAEAALAQAAAVAGADPKVARAALDAHRAVITHIHILLTSTAEADA